MTRKLARPYRAHLKAASELVTTYEATRAGFVSLALEKNRRATPYVAEARALQTAARQAKQPRDLLQAQGIEAGLLTAAGLSDKALNHLTDADKKKAIQELIENFLAPAGNKFVEELVFRFLITRGDALGGAMRNVGGILAQRKLSRAILSSLTIAGIPYQWQHSKTRQWATMTQDDAEIEYALRALSWEKGSKSRILIYNFTVPQVANNVDLSLLNLAPRGLNPPQLEAANVYLAFGELKGGVDPAGADEHWKTARSALERIRLAFSKLSMNPQTFFVGAAVEKKMADEIWHQLETGELTNAANLNDENQVASLARWLISI